MPAADAAGAAVIRLHAPSPMVARLATALSARGHALRSVRDAPSVAGGPAGHATGARRDPGLAHTFVFGPGEPAAAVADALWDAGPGDRVLVVGWIGTHRDARCAALRAAWELEERGRAAALPVLAVRLGPLVSRDSPLWHRLAAGPPAGRAARTVLHPALESDVVETLDRALRGRIDWSGWHELGGYEVFDLRELAALARAAAPAAGGEWEPGLDALAEQRLIEPGLWARWAGFEPASVRAGANAWAA